MEGRAWVECKRERIWGGEGWRIGVWERSGVEWGEGEMGKGGEWVEGDFWGGFEGILRGILSVILSQCQELSVDSQVVRKFTLFSFNAPPAWIPGGSRSFWGQYGA